MADTGQTGWFLEEPLYTQKTDFLLRRGRKFVCSLRVPPFHGVQDARDIAHTDSPTVPGLL